MGLFSVFRKEPKAPPPEDDFPELQNGMRVEVLTPTEVELFTGRIRLLESEVVEVRALDGGFVPRAVYGQQVRIRGTLEDGRGFVLEGSVGPNAPDFWRIERLRPPRTNQHREDFRQHVGAEGVVCPSEQFRGQKQPCRILDMSASGGRVITRAIFKEEGTFYLRVALLPRETPFVLTCLVKRVDVLTKPGSPTRKFEYGCQFIDMPEQERERLIQSIFELQRKSIRRW